MTCSFFAFSLLSGYPRMSGAGGKRIFHCGGLLRAVKSGLFRGDQSKRCPIEIGVAAFNSGDQPVSYDVDRRHWGARAVRLGERQAHILERERQTESGCVALRE